MEKKVVIKKTKTNKDKVYYKASVEATKEAMRVLTKPGFYLYMYFLQNQDKYNFILRRTNALQETTLSKTSYYAAIADLIEYGYLAETEDGYTFYELAKDNNAIEDDEEL